MREGNDSGLHISEDTLTSDRFAAGQAETEGSLDQVRYDGRSARACVPRRGLIPTLVFLGIVSTAVGSLGAPLLPTIIAVDHVSLVDSQWALTISLLVGAVATPVLGRLGDGRRKVVILATVFAVLIGCVVSALPLGFAALLIGRGLQGAGLALVPLAIAVARDALPVLEAEPAIALLGVTTAVGIGVGYPVAGLVTQTLGLNAAFWAGALVSMLALVAAAAVLPSTAKRTTQRVDLLGAALLGGAVTGLLLALSDGPTWGWHSPRLWVLATTSIFLLAVWVGRTVRVRQPLVDLRQLRHRSVLAANTTMLLTGSGIYPLLSLAVRYAQTPSGAGYGFNASVVVAGLVLVPFSLASFVTGRITHPFARRASPEVAVALSCLVLLVAMAVFLLARDTLWELLVALGLAGAGVGCIFAANPLQIVRGVPAAETGSALGFYQVLRAISFSAGSALSATVLAAFVPAGALLPTAGGYSAAALVSIGVLCAAFAVSVVFAVTSRQA